MTSPRATSWRRSSCRRRTISASTGSARTTATLDTRSAATLTCWRAVLPRSYRLLTWPNGKWVLFLNFVLFENYLLFNYIALSTGHNCNCFFLLLFSNSNGFATGMATSMEKVLSQEKKSPMGASVWLLWHGNKYKQLIILNTKRPNRLTQLLLLRSVNMLFACDFY